MRFPNGLRCGNLSLKHTASTTRRMLRLARTRGEIFTTYHYNITARRAKSHKFSDRSSLQSSPLAAQSTNHSLNQSSKTRAASVSSGDISPLTDDDRDGWSGEKRSSLLIWLVVGASAGRRADRYFACSRTRSLSLRLMNAAPFAGVIEVAFARQRSMARRSFVSVARCRAPLLCVLAAA